MRFLKLAQALLSLGALALVPAARAQQDHPVVIVAYQFVPGQAGELGLGTQVAVPVMINAGDTVTGTDLDMSPNAPHTITSDDIDPKTQALFFDSGAIGFNQSTSVSGVAALQPGTYPFHCKFHPFMHGVLVVQ